MNTLTRIRDRVALAMGGVTECLCNQPGCEECDHSLVVEDNRPPVQLTVRNRRYAQIVATAGFAAIWTTILVPYYVHIGA